MKIFKKILTVLILAIFMFNSSSYAYELNTNYENILIKNVISSKHELKTKIVSWEKYVEKIDNIISKIKGSKENLEKVQTKIYQLETKILSSNTNDITKQGKILAITWYIKAKISLELFRLEESLKEEQKNEIEEKIENMKNPNISKSDKDLVNKSLIDIQLNLLDSANNWLESIMKDFDKLSNYEEKGNLKMNFNLDQELIWKISSQIDFKDYKSKASLFDSQVNGDLKLSLDSELKWEKNIKLQIETFIDFISKDGNLYLLLKDLNITDESWVEEIKEQLEQLKEISKKNKYIKYEDINSQQAINMLKNFNPKTMFWQAESVLEKPLFKAYSKDWDKYYLTPTKYACDKYKEIISKFDPWNWNSCSDSQYEKMLEELAKVWDLYIELWDKNKLSFDFYPEWEVESFNSYIIFTDKNIEQINSKLTAKRDKWFSLDYIRNDKLNFDFDAWDDIKIKFNSELNNSNKFNFIDSEMTTKWYNNELNAELKLENKKINWNFEYKDKKYDSYDYNTWKTKYKDWNKITWNITWKQDNNLNLRDIELNFDWEDLSKNESFLNAKIKKQSDNYYFELEIIDNSKEIVNSNIKLENNKINGLTEIFNNWEGFITITQEWEYKTDYLELNNKIELVESPIAMSMKSLKWYSQMAKNSKVYSDTRSLVTAIEIGITNKDINSLDKLILEDNKINFIELKQNNEDFKQPDWKDYLIFVKDNRYYQIYWETIDNNWNITAVIRWNYIKTEENDPESLVEVNWNIIKDWDIIWKIEIEEEIKQKAEININIELDTEWNTNDAYIYIDYLEWNNKILEIEIDNEWTIEYKKVEVKAPREDETMELQEAMWY